MSGIVHEAVRGNVGLHFTVKLDADPAVEYDGNVKKIEVTPADKDASDLTFGEVQSGDDKEWALKTTALYSTAEGSLWSFLEANPNAEVVVVYGPHGNVVPTVAQPHFMLTVKTNGKPPHTIEARRTKERENFEYEWGEVTAGPVRVTV